MTEERKEIKKPTIGEPFWVYPEKLNRARFSLKRSDYAEEILRQMILKSIDAIKENPELKNPFQTLILERDWDENEEKTGDQFLKIALEKSGSITDDIELGLEFAQRIENGESWEGVSKEKEKFVTYIVILNRDKGTLHYLGDYPKPDYLCYGDDRRGEAYPISIHTEYWELTSNSRCKNTVPKITIR